MNDTSLFICSCSATLSTANSPQQCTCLREHAAPADIRYVYQLTIRPASADTTPTGVGRELHDTDVLSIGRAHGSVSYSQPLPNERILHYSLIPVTQMQALNGREFVEFWPNMEVRHRVSLTDNLAALQIDSECEGVKHQEVLAWGEYLERSKRWEPVTDCPWCDLPVAASQWDSADGWKRCPHCGGN